MEPACAVESAPVQVYQAESCTLPAAADAQRIKMEDEDSAHESAEEPFVESHGSGGGGTDVLHIQRPVRTRDYWRLVGRYSMRGYFPRGVRFCYVSEGRRQIVIAYQLEYDTKRVRYGAQIFRRDCEHERVSRREQRRTALERCTGKPVLLSGPHLEVTPRAGESDLQHALRASETLLRRQLEYDSFFESGNDDDQEQDDQCYYARIEERRRTLEHFLRQAVANAAHGVQGPRLPDWICRADNALPVLQLVCTGGNGGGSRSVSRDTSRNTSRGASESSRRRCDKHASSESVSRDSAPVPPPLSMQKRAALNATLLAQLAGMLRGAHVPRPDSVSA